MADTGLDEAASARAVATDLGFVVDKVILPYAEETLADLQPLMEGADCVLCSSFSIIARIAADLARVPVISVMLQPMALLSADDPSVLPNGSKALLKARSVLGASSVRWAMRLARSGLRRKFRALDNLRKRFGASEISGSELIDGPLQAHQVIGLWSPVFAPAPVDAPATFSLAGFAFYDGGFAGSGLPGGLEEFLAEGDPPIVFTLGTLAVYADDGFFAASAAAVQILERRAVLLVGDDMLPQHQALASPDIFVAGYAPHSILFARTAAVVHHGGIGTIAQALKAGIPQLVCPTFGDQFDNAFRVERRGLGHAMSKSAYSAHTAVTAIRALLMDERCCNFARQASNLMANEHGAQMAVATIKPAQPT